MKREDMNKIKELREANNLTQQQLADMLGLDRSTICKWEGGINFPRGAMLIKLSRIFKCTTDELLCVEVLLNHFKEGCGFMNNFANRLKLLRKNKGLSQEDLANALSVSQQAVARWEASLNQPNNETLVDLADYFDVTTDYLLGRESVNDGLDENLPCDDSDCGHGEELISDTKEILFSHMKRLNEAADKTNNADELWRLSLAMQSTTDAIVSLETYI